MIKLSEHFTLDEFIFSQTAVRHGISNYPSDDMIEKLKKTAENMEYVRNILGGKPINVSSAYRCHDLNVLRKSPPTSQHVKGEAVDFTCPSFGNPKTICQAIVSWDIDFDQLIYEGSWVHISFSERNRRSVLTASFIKGEVQYFDGIV